MGLKGWAKGGLLPAGSSDHLPYLLSPGTVILPKKSTHDFEVVLGKLNMSKWQEEFLAKYADFDAQITTHLHMTLSSTDPESEAWD